MLARAADDQHSTGRYTGVPLSTKSVLQELDVELLKADEKIIIFLCICSSALYSNQKNENDGEMI